MTLHASMELRQVLAEAEDIAAQVSQPLTTAHLLLGLFTLENRAKILLNEKDIDEDVLLEHVHTTGDETPDAVRNVKRKAAELAVGSGAEAVDCLHLLVSICGQRHTVAHELLERAGLNVAQFRNTALSYVTTAYPRRLTVKKKGRPSRQSPRARGGAQAATPSMAPSAPPAVIEEGDLDDVDDRPEVGLPRRPPPEDLRPDEMAEDGTPDEMQVSPWELAPTR